jgi:hypothetical protein
MLAAKVVYMANISQNLSKKTFEKCTQIQEKTFKKLNRVSSGQLKKKMVKFYMEPGMWWMMLIHMKKSL